MIALPCVWRQVLGQEDVWRQFATVLDNLLVVCNVVHVGSWEQLQAFLNDFAARRPGKPVSVFCGFLFCASCVAWSLAHLLMVLHSLPCVRHLAWQHGNT